MSTPQDSPRRRREKRRRFKKEQDLVLRKLAQAEPNRKDQSPTSEKPQ